MSLKVGVLMGGNSDERVVSKSTGKEVLKAIKKLGYQSKKILIRDNYQKLIKEFQKQDLIFNALHGGYGEDGKIQQWMDDNNIKYTGSGPSASSLCMDKARSKDLARLMGVMTPNWQVINNVNETPKLNYPLVIKPNRQGSTFGLTIVKHEKQLSTAIKKAFKYGDNIIAEEYIEGCEVTVPIVGDLVCPIIEIIPSRDLYDFDCKYTPGLTKYRCPAELGKNLTDSIMEDTSLLFIEFGCNVYARVDYLIDKNGCPYFLEVNTLPGMTKTSLLPKSLASIGITFDALIDRIVELSL